MRHDVLFLNALRTFETAVAAKTGKSWGPKDFGKSHGVAKLRSALIEEEAAEVIEALEEGDTEHLLKELCDLLYVTIGTAAVFGLDLVSAFNRVHTNNMMKIDLATLREDGKLVKPKNFPKVVLKDLVS